MNPPSAARPLRWLVDTNTLSEPVRPRPDPKVVQALQAHRAALALPATALQELHFGWLCMPPGRQRSRVGDYLQGTVAQLPVLPLDGAGARLQADLRCHALRAGRPMSYADSEIAAIAIANGLTLVTRNTRDFEGRPGLRVANWFDNSNP